MASAEFRQSCDFCKHVLPSLSAVQGIGQKWEDAGPDRSLVSVGCDRGCWEPTLFCTSGKGQGAQAEANGLFQGRCDVGALVHSTASAALTKCCCLF